LHSSTSSARVGPPPVDVERVRPSQDANEVAAEQVKVLLGRLVKVQTVPLFVFDASSMIP
jgi:hypothetical protein